MNNDPKSKCGPVCSNADAKGIQDDIIKILEEYKFKLMPRKKHDKDYIAIFITFRT